MRIAVLLVFGLLVLASVPAIPAEPAPPAVSQPSEVAPGLPLYIAGLPAASASTLRAGDALHGARVVRVNSVVGFVVLEVSDLAPLTDARDRGAVRYLEPDGTAWATWTPSDPLWGRQYGPQQVRAPEVWDLTRGSANKEVCVVDTGVQGTHEDLAGPRWLGGYDFVNEDGDPDDDHGHGTHVAGTAASGIDDGKGIAGLAQAGILAAKVLSANGGGSWDWVASGIQWCADQGADVISMSLGGGFSQTIQDAVTYAWQRGSLLVAAAGNNGPCNGCVISPASSPEVIAVTCVDSAVAQCSFSSEGPKAEIAAPGRFVHAPMAPGTTLGDYCATTLHEPDPNYCSISGTSMSTPHVSGVAALVWSAFPSLTNCQVRDVLRQAASDRGLGGFDEKFGYGLLDAKQAYDLAAAGSYPDAATCTFAPPTCSIVTPAAGERIGGAIPFTVATTSSRSAVTSVDVVLEDGRSFALADHGDGTFQGILDATQVADGSHRILARCSNADGRVGAEGRNVLFDSIPDPGVEIVSISSSLATPAVEGPRTSWDVDGLQLGRMSVGPQTVKVRAASNAGLPLTVELRINQGPWIDISASRDGDAYTYEWDPTWDAVQSQVVARATDAGGVAFDAAYVDQLASLHFVQQWPQCWFDALAGGMCCMAPITAQPLIRELTTFSCFRMT
jgi:subtilisin family serine protease